MLSCQQYFAKQTEQDEISNKIQTINQLFQQMNLKKGQESILHQRNTTSDSIETPIYDIPTRHQCVGVSSEFQKYLLRKQQNQDTLLIADKQSIQIENDDKEEDLLTEIRTQFYKNNSSQLKQIYKNTSLRTNNSSAATLKTRPATQIHQSSSLLRNKTEISMDLNSNRQLSQITSQRDKSKLERNKQIIENAYETFVEKKGQSKSPGIKQQQQLNILKHNYKQKICQLLSNTPEKKLRQTIALKKNYFIN